MISVIMLTYNRENLVGRAIESILSQTCQDFEFIIVDNGSTDHSGQVAETYAAEDSRVRVIHRERGNIGSGRNAGLDAAQGDYIAFIDDDDWAEPDFLEFLLNLAQEDNADVAVCGSSNKIFYEKKVMTPEEALVELMWRKKYNAGFPTKLFSKNLMQRFRFSTEDEFDDIGLMYMIFAQAGKVVYHGLPKYNVYRHPGNHSSWTEDHKLLTAEILDEYLHVYSTRTTWLCKMFPKHSRTFQYFEWSFMISMVEKVVRLNIRGCERQLIQMKQELHKHREEFLEAQEILDFEKEWMKKYVSIESMLSDDRK